ncbi:hypothetical protein AB0N06_26700 [Streptomyces sp. NPDC051020]|uniref:hypothetical protein n=1 Tax=Streptomyces sp. NPDC051020 TaxID=3155409 RepID=UPI0034488A63
MTDTASKIMEFSTSVIRVEDRACRRRNPAFRDSTKAFVVFVRNNFRPDACPLRGRGHGRELLDVLMADRTEPFAVLAASNEAPARELYRRWGWAKVGELMSPPDGVDLLAHPLRPMP